MSTQRFRVYAQTRATRQACDDVVEKIVRADYNSPEYEKWREVTDLLNRAECLLERLDLSKE